MLNTQVFGVLTSYVMLFSALGLILAFVVL
jgi:hypothetical protein